jgi:hypothetical protein
VTGASGPTGSDGRATVTLAETSPTIVALRATHGKDIPAPPAELSVCVGGICPKT